MQRMVGSREIIPAQVAIDKPRHCRRMENGQMTKWSDPFMPKSFKDPFHPGGNSLCYTLQAAHLMGCKRIYLLGFTLQDGLSYFFGRENPATRKTSFYNAGPPLAWCRWFEKQFPGKARLLPGWDGPIYDVFATEEFHDGRQQDARPSTEWIC